MILKTGKIHNNVLATDQVSLQKIHFTLRNICFVWLYFNVKAEITIFFLLKSCSTTPDCKKKIFKAGKRLTYLNILWYAFYY